MKKFKLFSVFFLVFLLCFAVCACHSKAEKNNINTNNKITISNQNLEILPAMSSVSTARNQAWVGTFQLIWNDLEEEIIKRPIKFVNYHSDMADELNKKSFTKDDLSDNAYYKKWGLVSSSMKTEIVNGIKEKFNETSDILDRFDWTPAKDKYILYAMLKKDFEFLEKFNKLEDDKFKGSIGNIKYFGLEENAPYEQRKTVEILFYNNPEDYAVLLKTKQGDEVYLYRTNDDKTLDEYYSDLKKKTNKYNKKEILGENDQFKAPILDFKTERDFPELCNKPIEKSRLQISKAIETVQFKMDETGVKLKSEAAMILEKAIFAEEQDSRFFYFNDKYIIFISEPSKKPYFAMKVTNPEELQK